MIREGTLNSVYQLMIAFLPILSLFSSVENWIGKWEVGNGKEQEGM